MRRLMLGAVAGAGGVLAGICLAGGLWLPGLLAGAAAITAGCQLPPTERQASLARTQRIRGK